jgi:hypothetical protein
MKHNPETLTNAVIIRTGYAIPLGIAGFIFTRHAAHSAASEDSSRKINQYLVLSLGMLALGAAKPISMPTIKSQCPSGIKAKLKSTFENQVVRITASIDNWIQDNQLFLLNDLHFIQTKTHLVTDLHQQYNDFTYNNNVLTITINKDDRFYSLIVSEDEGLTSEKLSGSRSINLNPETDYLITKNDASHTYLISVDENNHIYMCTY